ncbi:MFS transporter [Raoultibacter phocaeensis]|uniref:MFS transporter n=1 Tax=Raoultibacter phocaeensis TaxID=2479841 RepID=UPI0011192889|nr:MFS transporter [Raoultibacter phocaeensis]
MGSNAKKRVHFGFFVLFACCAICFSTVTLSFNTVGIFYVPASAELGIDAGRFGTYISVQYLAMSLAMIFGGKVLYRFNARVVLSVCVAMVSLGLLSMSTFTALWQFYCAGAIIGAANSILLYLMVPTMIDRWFKERVGFFVGVALCFTGIGAIIFNPIGGFFIDSFGWRAGYLAFGLISACIGFPCAAFLIRNAPADKGLVRYGEKASARLGKSGDTVLEGATFSQALRTPVLYMVALYAGVADIGLTLNYYLPAYATTLGYSVLVVSSIASAVLVGQLLGKLLLGFINDISVKAGVFAAVTSGILGIGIMTFLGGTGLIALYVGAFLFGVFFASTTVTTSLMTRGIFGSRDYGRIFSVVATVASLSSAFSSAIWGALIEATGGYYAMLYGGLGVMFIVYIIGFAALAMGKRSPWVNGSCAAEQTVKAEGSEVSAVDDVSL